MLTLTRSVGESIRIGEDIEVYVVEVRGGTVRLGFKAPREVVIHREEVYRQIAEANALAAEVAADVAGALATFAPSAPAPVAEPTPSPPPAPTAAPTAALARAKAPERRGPAPAADQRILKK